MKIKIAALQLLIVCMLFPFSLRGQETSMINYVDKSSIILTEKQEHLLETIRARPQSQTVYLITLPNISNVKNKASIIFNLPKGRTVSAQKRRFKGESENKFILVLLHYSRR